MLSDTLITALSNTVIAGVVTIVLAYIHAVTERRKAEKVEALRKENKAERVQALGQRNRMEKTGLGTHSLVNSAMTQQLKISAILARRVATLSGHADDEVVAKAAETAYKANLDSQPKAPRASGNVFSDQKADGS